MNYFMNELGLDRTTAVLMQRAERLQERGQLSQALWYFQEVLLQRPNCQEAAVNIRMVNSMLDEAFAQKERKEPGALGGVQRDGEDAARSIRMPRAADAGPFRHWSLSQRVGPTLVPFATQGRLIADGD